MHGFGLAIIGRDVEIRRTPNGDVVANVSLAFSYGRKGEDGKRPTTWVDGALWGARAEALAPYLLKGAKVAVTLKDLAIEAFTNRDGDVRSKLVARIEDVALAGSPRPAENPAAAPAPRPAARAPAPANRPSGAFDDMDDDVPFIVSINDYSLRTPKERRMARCDFK